MELLVVTLAHTTASREADGQAQIRLISETVRNAPGLVSARYYASRTRGDTYHLFLTTWEDEESWQRARERHSPRHLLQSSASEFLASPPEQWLMHYLWGYSRPAASPVLAEAQLVITQPEQADYVQKSWLEGLRKQSVQPTLVFAFLARGINEGGLPARPTGSAANGKELPYQHGPIFLNLLSWSSEADQEEFRADANYQGISRLLSGVGVVQGLTLELP